MSHALDIGDLFAGRYRLEALLGRSAFATVFRATQLDLERPVALKLLAVPPEGTLSRGVRGSIHRAILRFEREAKLISRLHSPYTVSIYAVGRDEASGALFIATEFVDGHTLRDVFALGAMEPARVVALLEQILSTLQEAHALGVLHRDIRPANIMITASGQHSERAKLLDFGMHKHAPSEDAGEVDALGAPSYTSPEQLHDADLTPASDLYSLGLVAYEMLTGERAIRASDTKQRLAHHVRGDEVTLPADLPHPISPGLRALVDRMMRRDVNARYQRAEDVLLDLAALERGAAPDPFDTSQEFVPDIENTRPQFDALLQGKDAWWEFLGAKSRGEDLGVTVGNFGATPSQAVFALDDASPTLELEETFELMQPASMAAHTAPRGAARAQPLFQPHDTPALRCTTCRAQIPADLMFCVYCGADPPLRSAPSERVLVISALTDASLRDEVAELIASSNGSLDAREIDSALAQPPALFTFIAHDEHAVALADRLAEVGVQAQVGFVRDTDVSMHREYVEAIWRNPRYFGAHIANLVAWASAALVAGIPGLTAVVGVVVTTLTLGALQSRTFTDRYRLDALAILRQLTGVDTHLERDARKALRTLRDEDVRELLTLCLIEHYAVWRQLSAAPPSLRGLLGPLYENLEKLMHQVMRSCLRYAELHNYVTANDPDSLARRVAELERDLRAEQDLARAKLLARELEQRRIQLDTVRRLASTLPMVRQQLLTFSSSMEYLRSRVVNMTLTRHSVDDDSVLLQAVLMDLDDEVTIFEQTLAEAAEEAPAFAFS